jgi:hypothetical protein
VDLQDIHVHQRYYQISFYGPCIVVSMFMSSSSLQTNEVKSSPVLHRLSSHYSQLLHGIMAGGIRFLLGLTVHNNRFSSAGIQKRSCDERKLSTHTRTRAHTHTHIYISLCVCEREREREREREFMSKSCHLSCQMSWHSHESLWYQQQHVKCNLAMLATKMTHVPPKSPADWKRFLFNN